MKNFKIEYDDNSEFCANFIGPQFNITIDDNTFQIDLSENIKKQLIEEIENSTQYKAYQIKLELDKIMQFMKNSSLNHELIDLLTPSTLFGKIMTQPTQLVDNKNLIAVSRRFKNVDEFKAHIDKIQYFYNIAIDPNDEVIFRGVINND